ncbi:MAG: NAD-dependent epimerase/dehydratase family protein [Planctomycetota bacterium]|jgi:UDP-glucose 4-epimerase
MRHLVTGGAGFVGSHLVEALLARGDEVEVLDDLSGGADGIGAAAVHPRLRRTCASVLDASTVRSIVDRVDRVWHLAAVVGVPRVLADPRRAVRVNLEGTEVVVDACAAAGVPLVFTSSSEVYGDRAGELLREDDPVSPGATTSMRGSYGASKALAEWALAAVRRESGLPVLVVRLFNTVGPRQRAGHGMVLPRFVEQARKGRPLTVYGDGAQRRCFADVRDVASHLVRLADREDAFGRTFNVGSRVETSILGLAQLVRDLAGTGSEIAHVPWREAFPGEERDVRRRVPDLGRLAAAVGSVPATPLEETVAAMLASGVPVTAEAP